MAEPIDGEWLTVQRDRTESGQHRVRLEHDGLFGIGIGDTPDQAMWRALQALSASFFQRSLTVSREAEEGLENESELEP
jgi:hypothetical protein